MYLPLAADDDVCDMIIPSLLIMDTFFEIEFAFFSVILLLRFVHYTIITLIMFA